MFYRHYIRFVHLLPWKYTNDTHLHVVGKMLKSSAGEKNRVCNIDRAAMLGRACACGRA